MLVPAADVALQELLGRLLLIGVWAGWSLRTWWRWVQSRREWKRKEQRLLELSQEIERYDQEIAELKNAIEVERWFAQQKQRWAEEKGHDPDYYRRN